MKNPEDQELLDYCDRHLEMCEMPEFVEIMNKAVILRNEYNSVANTPDQNTFLVNKGRVDILNWLINWETHIRMLKQQVSERNDAETDF